MVTDHRLKGTESGPYVVNIPSLQSISRVLLNPGISDWVGDLLCQNDTEDLPDDVISRWPYIRLWFRSGFRSDLDNGTAALGFRIAYRSSTGEYISLDILAREVFHYSW